MSGSKSHRRAPWVMAQTWQDLLFAHWPVDLGELRRAVPAVLPLDTFEGTAWLGVVPFRMRGVRGRWMPPLPGLSAFPELNVRTYVTVGGKPGVYFFSLDAGNAAAVLFGRRCYHLPYYRARMTTAHVDGVVRYTSRRTHRGAPPARFRALYHPTGSIYRAVPGTLDYFLTERYCLYTVDAGGRIYRTDIAHPPWPLQPAEAQIRLNTMARPHGITLPDTPPLLWFAPRLEVQIWWPRLVPQEG